LMPLSIMSEQRGQMIGMIPGIINKKGR
jgi:hypothetical protein